MKSSCSEKDSNLSLKALTLLRKEVQSDWGNRYPAGLNQN